MTEAPILWWVRRDLRLSDNPCLAAVAATGRPVIPVAIRDAATDALGAAPKWRLGLGLEVFGKALRGIGSRLVLRSGPALRVLADLAEETGATAVHWSRLYDPGSRQRDGGVKGGLRALGLEAVSHAGHLLHEPWEVATGQGGFYRVYTPFWKAVRDRPVPPPAPAVTALRPPPDWPGTEAPGDWRMAVAMNRGAAVVARHARPGEAAALDRMAGFLAASLPQYRARRDFPAEDGTSGLSENLALGEIGPRSLWHAAKAAFHEGRGDETFLKELVWREFAWHLLYHTPHIASANWRPEWDGFPWQGDNDLAERWRQGRTGVALVDAGMRQMYVTGRMHNRARMIVASYLTKHLMTDWRVGLAWFEDCLTDWDPASNAMGWQWAAGSGPDAAPYFRIFNPDTQAERFDPEAAYRRRFLAELSPRPEGDALAFFDAVPRSWGLSPGMPYPSPVVGLAEGRARALAAYAARNP